MTASASTSTKGGVDESTDLHDRRSRADVGEELAMRPPDFLPAVDIGHEHPGAHNVLKVRTNLFKGFRDSADSFAGLLSYILAGGATIVFATRQMRFASLATLVVRLDHGRFV